MSRPRPSGSGNRPRSEAGAPRDAAAREFVADWLAHVAAGRIGNNPPMSEETRAAILANERVIRGETPRSDS